MYQIKVELRDNHKKSIPLEKRKKKDREDQ